MMMKNGLSRKILEVTTLRWFDQLFINKRLGLSKEQQKTQPFSKVDSVTAS